MAKKTGIEQDAVVALTTGEAEAIAQFCDNVGGLIDLMPAARNIAKVLRAKQPIKQKRDPETPTEAAS